MAPLFQALPGKKKPTFLSWTDPKMSVFEKTKTVLAEATLLAHPQSNAETTIRFFTFLLSFRNFSMTLMPLLLIAFPSIIDHSQ